MQKKKAIDGKLGTWKNASSCGHRKKDSTLVEMKRILTNGQNGEERQRNIGMCEEGLDLRMIHMKNQLSAGPYNYEVP